MKSKEIKNILQNIDKTMSEPMPIGPTSIAVTIAILGLAMYGMNLAYKAENNLTDAKQYMDNPPVASVICNIDDPLSMGCWYQKTDEVCDGQNTMFDQEDDICETLEFWAYKPVVNYFR